MTKIRTKKLIIKIFPWLAAAATLAAISAIAYSLIFFDRIYPGISAAGTPLSGRTILQAEETLKKSLPSLDHGLIIINDSRKWKWGLEEISFDYQKRETAEAAYKIGRGRGFWENFKTRIRLLATPKDIPAAFSLNEASLGNKINQLADETFVPAVEPTIKIIDGQISIDQGKLGLRLQKDIFDQRLRAQLAAANFGPITLPTENFGTTLSPTQTENIRRRAKNLIGRNILIENEGNAINLNDENLINFLAPEDNLNMEKINLWAEDNLATLDREPENAAFQFEAGRVVEFRPAKNGQRVDYPKTVNLLKTAIKKLESGEPKIEVILPVEILSPAIKTSDVNRLGINELVGEGISYFKSSISSRIHNIQLATSKINGLLVAPNETFSFNNSLGDVAKATGYEEAYIIREGRTVLGDGGGVCQVSTTLFRAALNAGLPIIERHAHAYRVAYYEQNSQPGLDATVFSPTADLRFKNDTPAYLLIQAAIDPKNKRLTFDLYGTGDGRKSGISQSKIWDQTPPPPDLYQDDPTLPAGTIKQIDWSAWGAKISFKYRVEKSGEILQDRTFYSAFSPWQAIFLRGTKVSQ